MENPPFDDEFPVGQPGVFQSAPIWLGSVRVSQQAPRILKDVPSPKKMDQLISMDLVTSGFIS